MTLAELLLAGMLSLPTFTEDRAPELAEAKRAQYEQFAREAADVADEQKVTTSRNWSAMLAAVAIAETGLSLRIQAGHCEPHECDRGRARGPFQNHKYAESIATWDKLIGVENTRVQVRVAHARLLRGYYTCRGASDWLTATLTGYAGRRCGTVWPGLEMRVATWRRVLRGMEVRS